MSNRYQHHAVDSAGNQLQQFINIMKLRKDTLLLSIFPPPAGCFLFPCLHLSEATACSTGITTRSSSIQRWIFIMTLPDCLSYCHSSLRCFQSKCPFKIGSVMHGLLFQQDVMSKSMSQGVTTTDDKNALPISSCLNPKGPKTVSLCVP